MDDSASRRAAEQLQKHLLGPSFSLPSTTQNPLISTEQKKMEDSRGVKGGGDLQISQIKDPIGYEERPNHPDYEPSFRDEVSSHSLDDGYCWRKYGQKSIDSHYPRSYYKCTHRNQGCKAAKWVQQVREEPTLYRITYKGRHTCQTALPIKTPSSSSAIDDNFINNNLPDQSTITTSKDNKYSAIFNQPTSSSSIISSPTGDPVHVDNKQDRPRLADWDRFFTATCENTTAPYLQSIFRATTDCDSIFSLLPTNYDLEEDTLVQLWMGMGFIEDESDGQERFHSLLNARYLVHSGSNFVTRKAKYRLHKTKIDDLLYGHSDIDEGFYLKWEDESPKIIINTTEIQHASLVCNDIDASTFQTLQQLTELSTLLFIHNYGNKVTQVPDGLFLSCQKLRTLDLSGSHIKKLSSFVGLLNQLRYLDLSRTLIEWLPDTICSLAELQTLKLKGCVKLRGLPKKLKKLTKLRHLDVDVLRQLATLPGGIGALVSLRTLSAFLVGTEDGCKIQELKELNSLAGDFCIAMLENVGNGDEAKGASLDNKHYINKLELRWTASQLLRTNNNCYDVLKSLRPCILLEELQIFCYQGSKFPDWVSDPTFYHLVSVTFFQCELVSELPLVEQLPFLKHLELVKMNGVKKIERRGESDQVAFSRLKKLVVDEMLSLRSWNWAETNEDDFKRLVELTINDCPGLREFHVFPCLPSIEHFEVKGCPQLESLSETKLPDTLVELIVEDCPMIERKCSQRGGEDWEKIQHVAHIHIYEEDVDDDKC